MKPVCFSHQIWLAVSPEFYSLFVRWAKPVLAFMTPAFNLMVTTLNFSSFSNQEVTLEAGGFRVCGLNADLANDVEPEYVALP